MNRSLEVLFISKPVSPPWNDSSKNLVRDIAVNMRRYRPVILSRRGVERDLPGVQADEIYPAGGAGRFSPAFADNARVMLHLLLRKPIHLWHFFFAPNPRSSRISAVASRLRRMATVQTICSAPSLEVDIRSLLFADRTVVLSRHTEERLLASGIEPKSVVRIPPAVRSPASRTEEEKKATRDRFRLPCDKLLLIYPGDLEFGTGAQKAIYALADLPKGISAHLVMACRAKTDRAQEEERRLRQLVQSLGVGLLVTWVGETSDIHALLAVADLVLLPSETLYAKMDLPLVLIEAMALRRPVLVVSGTAAAELADNQAAMAVDGSRESVSAAVSRLLDDREQRNAMGERASLLVQERFEPCKVAAAYEKMYDEIVDN
ncbi:MAG: glycosyltransferase family 4 protein [Deltaproteobacteria bacterium]|nr:glycosyltransferase family 4 protein [Deltaproteobacteria bacterium]